VLGANISVEADMFFLSPANACCPCHYHSIYGTENEEIE
jgi:hypothetical protein